jgi:hypothetical protein
LPCVFIMAHGKVFSPLTHSEQTKCNSFKKYFVVRIYYSARQTIFYLFSLGPKSNYSKKTLGTFKYFSNLRIQHVILLVDSCSNLLYLTN